MYFSGLHKTIRNLEEKKFYDIALLFLSARGYQDLSIIDGTGDGGRDVKCSWPHIRIQLSVQKNWENKINKEAETAHKSGFKHFIYITNRKIKDNERESFIQGSFKHKGQVELTIFDLDSVATSLSLPGIMRSAYERLGIIIDNKISATPKEIALSNTLLFSKEARDLRDNILESAIKAELLVNPGMIESKLIHVVSEDLGHLNLSNQIHQAYQRLRMSGDLVLSGDTISLSKTAKEQISAARQDYIQAKSFDLDHLKQNFSLSTEKADALIEVALEIHARRGSFDGDDAYEVRLNDIISNAGLSRQRQKVYDELSTLSCAKISQYGEAVNHIFSTNTFDIFRALGRTTSVSTILDSSVAMPMLFGLSFNHARSRYGIGASALSKMCEAHKIPLKVPRAYLNEIAYHGKKALEHVEIYKILGEEPRNVLRASGNAYISHFSHIREDKKIGTKIGLKEFLEHFGIENEAPLWAIEDRIETILSSFNIEVISNPRWEDKIRQKISSEKPNEAPVIIDHDAIVVTLMTQDASNGYVFATWDNALIKIVEKTGRVYADTPSRVVDFLSMAKGTDYDSEQTVSLLDALIHCDERKTAALARKIEAIKSSEMAYELQMYTDAARKSKSTHASSSDLVADFFAHHNQSK